MPPEIRRFNWHRDRKAVLEFQYEIYETNFPGLQVDEVFLDGYERQLRAATRQAAERLWVLDNRGDVCGFIWAALITTMVDSCVGYIKNLYVAPEWRGQGCAEELLTTAEQWFRRKGAQKAALDASVCNEQALALYERCGYQVSRLRLEKSITDAAGR